MKLEPFKSSAESIAQGVRGKEISAIEVAKFFADRTDQLHPKLNSHIHWDRKKSLERAEKLELANGHPLAGVPVLIKDNICIEGEPVTCGSKILKGFISPYTATAVERLMQAGAIPFGKANCDEYAMGSSNENSAYGAVKSPWDTARVPGGSSGGSAAAVAGNLVPAALGSDTGGSVRQPASFCGIVGLKPTYGRISRYGLVAYGSSLDQIGPMTRTVKDSALLLDAMSGHDPKDSTSLEQSPTKSYAAILEAEKEGRSLRGIKVGLVKEFMGEGMEPDVRASVEAAIQKLKDLGATVEPVSLPHLEYSLPTYYIIATAEASANLARFDGIRYGYRSPGHSSSLKDLYQFSRTEGFGREVKQRIMLGTFVLSSGYYDAYYNKANRVRKMISDDFAAAFSKVDFLVSPTSPTTAFKIGEKSEDPISMYLSDICTIGVNLAGVPGISVPCGYDSKGLPIGLQMIGPRLSDEKLLTWAYIYEQSTQWIEKATPRI